MMIPRIRYRSSSAIVPTTWAAVYRGLDEKTFHALGCRPDADDPSMPNLHKVVGRSPAIAYKNLVEATARPWWVVVREEDALEMTPQQWRELVLTTPQVRMVSEVLWRRAELIWLGARDDLERSRGLWLALTAAHDSMVDPGWN